MPATNENLLDSLNQNNRRIHYLAKDYLEKIDNLYEKGDYKISENTFTFTFNALNDDNCDDCKKIASEIKNMRNYANVDVKVVSDSEYAEMKRECNFIAIVCIEPKLIK